MKISGLKQKKSIKKPRINLPSVHLRRPKLSRGKIALLIVCAALAVACCVLCFVYSSTAGRLLTQQVAERYQGTVEQRYAQASVFFPVGQEKSISEIYTFRSTIDKKLLDVSLEAAEGAPPLWQDAYSGTGELTVEGNKGKATVTATGVGGDWFSFHPLTLRSGGYLDENDLMHDRVMLDEKLAWQIFGSYDLAGMTVVINGKPFVVAGVVAIEDDKATEKTYTATGEVFMHLDTLQQLLGEESGSGGVSCYELVCAEPISGFTLGVVTEGFEGAQTVQNSGRFSPLSILKVVRAYGTRSMQTAGVAYPYWENAARLTEDTLAALMICIILTALLPVACLVWYIVRALRRGWLYLRWEAGPAFWERTSDRIREKQRIALKRRQKRIEEQWVKDDDSNDPPQA